MGETEGEGEGGITQRDGEHVHGEPEVVAQHRDERVEPGRHGDREAAHEKEAEKADRQGAQKHEAVAVDGVEDETKHNGAHRHPDNRFIHVGHRSALRDQDAQEKSVKHKGERRRAQCDTSAQQPMPRSVPCAGHQEQRGRHQQPHRGVERFESIVEILAVDHRLGRVDVGIKRAEIIDETLGGGIERRVVAFASSDVQIAQILQNGRGFFRRIGGGELVDGQPWRPRGRARRRRSDEESGGGAEGVEKLQPSEHALGFRIQTRHRFAGLAEGGRFLRERGKTGGGGEFFAGEAFARGVQAELFDERTVGDEDHRIRAPVAGGEEFGEGERAAVE